MTRLMILAIAVMLLQPQEDRWSSITAFNRSGLHHVTVTGRLLDQKNQVVTNARVMLRNGGVRTISLAETRSGPDGKFKFHDISSNQAIGIVVDPPENLIPIVHPVDAVTGKVAHVGDVQLNPNTTIRAVLEVAGKPLDESKLIMVRLYSTDVRQDMIPGERQGNEYVF